MPVFFTLSPEDIKLINPNTKNCPIFRSSRDAEITKSVYRRVPILWKEEGDVNPWGISFQAMFHMANDSGLFATRATLLEKGFNLEGNVFVKGEEKWLPLYEAKMVWQYDHRFGTFEGVDNRTNTSLPPVDHQDIRGMGALAQPWYWVSNEAVNEKTSSISSWQIVYRNITNATNERTGIFALIPMSGVGHSAPVIHFSTDIPTRNIFFIANMSCICLDYYLRQKLGGTNFTYFIVKQLPIIPNTTYTPEYVKLITPKVIELTYTAWDLEGFAHDILKEIGEETWNTWFPDNPVHEGRVDPFIWDEERRFTLQRELDAIYARLYGLSRDDLAYILDTFPIVNKHDEEVYGRFRTKEEVLMWYDHYANIEPYQKST